VGGAPGILYISYDGMLEPLGQSQVLAYLEKLAPGRLIHLISFEKAADWSDQARRLAIQDRLAAAGIAWHPLRYHKRPSAPATALDIAHGSARAVGLVRKHRLGVVHARSYVAAAMALAAKKLTGAAFLFDMRGLWADERVDGDLWSSNGGLYRAAKSLERHFLLDADQVVTLTHASEAEIRRFDYLSGRTPPIAVIPTCADLDRFTIQGPRVRDPLVLGYVGSLGTWYLLDEMLRCFRFVREEHPNARLLFVNRNEQELIRSRAAAMDIPDEVLDVTAAEHRDMPSLIARMSIGMALIKPSYSKIASAPTKLAEYLGCGVPCLGNAGVGDMKSILEGRRVGAAAAGLGGDDLLAAIRRLLLLLRESDLQQRCRQAAQEMFSLESGVELYASIYDRLERRAS
jgi:glycosyltransferase involved in cell wall biosynthesis